MKKVLNFFSKPDEQFRAARTTYVSREPTLDPRPERMVRNASPSNARQAPPAQRPAPEPSSPAARTKPEPIPPDYAGIVEFFHRKIRDRKSPYNNLVTAADALKNFIPDETSRLKAVIAVCPDKWPLDALSLAISTHISDIELIRNKAKEDTQSQTTERVDDFRKQAERLKQENLRLESEINALNESIRKMQATLHANQDTLASLHEHIQLAQVHASSVSFIDQAAENLKNDLLAKKVILGLP